jgi:hypothetical protein
MEHVSGTPMPPPVQSIALGSIAQPNAQAPPLGTTRLAESSGAFTKQRIDGRQAAAFVGIEASIQMFFAVECGRV